MADVVPGELFASPVTSSPLTLRPSLRRYRYGPGGLQASTGLWTGLFPGARWTVAVRPRSTCGGTLEEIAESERAPGKAVTPSARMCCSRSRRCSTTPALRREAHRVGLLPRPARLDGGHDRAHGGSGRALCAGLPGPDPREGLGGPADIERRNRNIVGGDINGGLDGPPTTLLPPGGKLVPYRTPLKGLYICSSSTPPGGGVHGMCGYSAALVALRDS